MKKWELLSQIQITKENVVDVLLHNRKIGDEERELFLHPDLESVTTDYVGIDKKQLEKAIKRVREGIEAKEKMIVFGDYDVDGITGAAIIWETIHSLCGNILPYIPHRIDEGYGLSIKGISNVQSQIPDLKLIITVDNGIVANEAVDYANSLGIDVIITDHHVEHTGKGTEETRETKETEGKAKNKESNYDCAPNACAIVHTTKLCGAGVGYLFMQELKKVLLEKSDIEIPDQVRDDNKEDDHLELVALATVADLVPLTGANRTLLTYGLEKLKNTKRPGLLALFSLAGIDRREIGVYTTGHVIAPRLNAAGRLESAMDSLRLLCTHDKKKAYMLAELLDQINKERQDIMRASSEHAIGSFKSQASSLKRVLITGHESYPQGVIGLVAGKLVEEFYRPAIVFSIGEEFSKASARSVSGVNIIEFIRLAKEHIVAAGGHPMAAGLTIETAKFPAFKEFLEAQAEMLVTDEHLTRVLKIDGLIDLNSIDQEFYETLQLLAPYGMGNPEPVFQAENVQVKECKLLGREGKHMKLFCVQENGRSIEAVAFGMGDRVSEIQPGKKIDLAFTVDENVWNGRRSLQLKVKGVRTEVN